MSIVKSFLMLVLGAGLSSYLHVIIRYHKKGYRQAFWWALGLSAIPWMIIFYLVTLND